ncbi:MAG TPA: carbon-nitrogen hydrolase family protein [Aquifex aeolicus]|nr:carbon-nitrogen hydrolase family protein [Aquifex aeolicus]
MKLYSVQFKLENPKTNIEKVKNFLEKVENSSLVLLPEMWYSGFDYDNLTLFADLTPNILKELMKISREKSLVICGTLPERTSKGIMNVAFLIEDGKLLGKRGKIKLFSLFDEDKYFIPDDKNEVFETKFGKVGILICFEIRFTDLILELQKNKPDIVLVPAQWGFKRKDHFMALTKSRAIELQAYLVASNTWGEYLGTRFAGYSSIYSPWGETLAFSEKGDVILSAEYDKDYLMEVRKTLPIKI